MFTNELLQLPPLALACNERPSVLLVSFRRNPRTPPLVLLLADGQFSCPSCLYKDKLLYNEAVGGLQNGQKEMYALLVTSERSDLLGLA